MSLAPAGDSLTNALARRASLSRDGRLTALRLVNGVGDGLSGIHVDRLGTLLFAHVDEEAATEFETLLPQLVAALQPQAVMRKWLRRNVRTHSPDELKPEVVFPAPAVPGEVAVSAVPDEFLVQEQELRLLVRPREGYSYGLFLDQRENRARAAALVARQVAQSGAATLLNTFCYTGSFSVAAALAGGRTTSVDLSARYLDWTRANFRANGLDPETQELARGDALTFMQIAAKKGRTFDVVILDPPTFSTSKQSGVFQVESHYTKLFALAARITAKGGTLLCSHNQRTLEQTLLAQKLWNGARDAGRRILTVEPFVPPRDFPGPEDVNPAARGCWVTLD